MNITDTSKAFFCAALLALAGSCKKNESTDADTDAANATTVTDTSNTNSTGANSSGSSSNESGAHLRQHHNARKLTQDEIDSIKAERDKIVTPPANSGASATPGSGPAVPGNNKTVPGTNASQSSSTGIKKERK